MTHVDAICYRAQWEMSPVTRVSSGVLELRHLPHDGILGLLDATRGLLCAACFQNFHCAVKALIAIVELLPLLKGSG